MLGIALDLSLRYNMGWFLTFFSVPVAAIVLWYSVLSDRAGSTLDHILGEPETSTGKLQRSATWCMLFAHIVAIVAVQLLISVLGVAVYLIVWKVRA